MREEASFRMFVENVRASKQKLEIDHPKPPKNRKVSSYCEEGEAPVEFVSAVEEPSLYLGRNITSKLVR